MSEIHHFHQNPEANEGKEEIEVEEHHPRLQLNEAIHQPVRLSLLSILTHAQKVDFAFLRDHLELGDSNLSRHLTALEEMGFIVIEKVFEKKRPRTWVSLSPKGREAFNEYTQILQRIMQYSSPTIEENMSEAQKHAVTGDKYG